MIVSFNKNYGRLWRANTKDEIIQALKKFPVYSALPDKELKEIATRWKAELDKCRVPLKPNDRQSSKD